LASTSSTPSEHRLAIRDGIGYCLQRRNLRRTVRIAAIVGLILTLINQGSVIAAGDAAAATWIRCAVNSVVPLLVSNAGLLSGRPGGANRRPHDGPRHHDPRDLVAGPRRASG
jgi:hypothetical protein